MDNNESETKRRSNKIRYVIYMRNNIKNGYYITSLILLFISIGCFFYFYKKDDYYAIRSPLLFIVLSIILVFMTFKKLTVYSDGRLVYFNRLWRRTYRLKDVYTCTSDFKESSSSFSPRGGSTFVRGSDYITKFYNSDEEKLFSFGLNYENVELLLADIENDQKNREDDDPQQNIQ